MRNTVFIFLLGTLVFLQRASAQQNDSCSGRLSLAKDMYDQGKFEDALNMVEEYQQCTGTKTSAYFKLRAKIYLALDSNQLSLSSVTNYVNSKQSDYIADDDPAMFKDMVQYVQDSLADRQISSVSKRPEEIDLTPATVIVLKSQDFANRGYGNLVDLLSDLPGFDISRNYSAAYANIYQRGFRQDNTELTLFMIDGVEENDVWSNIAYISRQYPLSDISSVEIIYGPASTMYGTRAFAGAINVITKNYKELAKAKSSGYGANADSSHLNLHTSANISYGTYDTKNLDMTVGGKSKYFTYVLSGAYYESNENNLSSEDFYNTSPGIVDSLINNMSYTASINKMQYTGTVAAVAAEVNHLGLTPGSPYYNYFQGYGTGTITANPDSVNALIAKAKKIDIAGYNVNINGNPIGYSNRAADWSVSGKMRIGSLELGFRTWKLKEGFNYYQNLYNAGTQNGSIWAPINTSVYSKYDKTFDNFTFSSLNSYQISGLDKSTDLVTYNSFYSEANNLSVLSILFPDSVINGNQHGWINKFYYYKAAQFRSDNKISYVKGRLSVLAGLEYRYSELPGDYTSYYSYATANPVNQSNVAYGQELGTTSTLLPGNNEYNELDLGAYTQETYTLKDSVLYATAGGRYDYNRINTNGGFGSAFSPKFALVASLKKIVAKLIYSQGIQSPSQYDLYSTGGGRVPNASLQPERIKNYEISVLNKHGKTPLNWDVSASFTPIYDAILTATDPQNTAKLVNVNNGKYSIFTVQSDLIYHLENSPWNLYVNATYTLAKQTANSSVSNFTTETIGDIAPYKMNAGGDYAFFNRALNIDLRANYVGAKPVGPGTTVPASAGVDSTNSIPQYLIFNSAITYHCPKKLKGLSAQFVVNNIFNSVYYSPGVRNANGNFTNAISGFVPYVPQRGRNFLITIKLNM